MKHPRGAILSLALVLTIAGLITTPREGAAFRMRWEDPGPWTTGEPDIPPGGSVEKVPAGERVLVPVLGVAGGYFAIAVPVRLMIPINFRALIHQTREIR